MWSRADCLPLLPTLDVARPVVDEDELEEERVVVVDRVVPVVAVEVALNCVVNPPPAVANNPVAVDAGPESVLSTEVELTALLPDEAVLDATSELAPPPVPEQQLGVPAGQAVPSLQQVHEEGTQFPPHREELGVQDVGAPEQVWPLGQQPSVSQ